MCVLTGACVPLHKCGSQRSEVREPLSKTVPSFHYALLGSNSGHVWQVLSPTAPALEPRGFKIKPPDEGTVCALGKAHSKHTVVLC